MTPTNQRILDFLDTVDEETGDDVDIWKPTLVDAKNDHSEAGDIVFENESDHDHPDAPDVPDTYFQMHRRDGGYEVTITTWDEVCKTFSDVDALLSFARRFVRETTQDRSRADQYGSRQRERRLRQDERRSIA